MARKDFEEYYNKIKRQYFQLVDTIDETGKLVSKKMADPQVLENLTNILQPIKNSYMSLAYTEYLLNLPKDKKIKKRNEKQFKAELNKIDEKYRGSGVICQNNKAIADINSLINEELR